MTTFEKATLIIGILNLLCLVIGFIIALVQIKNSSNALSLQLSDTQKVLENNNLLHQADHDWNRRLAAQEALRHFNYSLLDSPLREKFDYLTLKRAIPLQEILEAFNQNATLRSNAHQLLNYYESLARGINQGIFDEEVIKVARKNAMSMNVIAFQHYITDRRTISPKAWLELTDIVQKWKDEPPYAIKREPANAFII